MGKGNIVVKKTVMVTEEGNVLLEAGDIITEDISATQEIDSLKKTNRSYPDDKAVEWKSGRPYDLIVSGIKKRVSSNRVHKTYGDMDVVLPSKILARRKKLVLDRMRQERSR